MARPERPVQDEGPLGKFAKALRAVRAESGITYRQMAKKARFSHVALASAAAGRHVPTWPLTLEYLQACGVADLETWRCRWEQLPNNAGPHMPQPPAGAPAADKPGLSEARAVFAARLNELVVSSGLSLTAIAVRVMRRFPGAPTSLDRRLSEWKRGVRIPTDEKVLLAVVNVLIESCRDRYPPPELTSKGLLFDERSWRRLWQDSQTTPNRSSPSTGGVRVQPGDAEKAGKVFATRLAEVLHVSGLSYRKAALLAMRQRPPTATWGVTEREIIAWTTGTRLPASDQALFALIRVLTEHARVVRASSTDKFPPEKDWAVLLSKARTAAPQPVQAHTLADFAETIGTLDLQHFVECGSMFSRLPRNPRRAHGSGRARAIAELSTWLDQPVPPISPKFHPGTNADAVAGGARETLRIVTGSPGSGKSALLGVLVCAAHPNLRADTEQSWLQLQDPPAANGNLVAVHAAGRRILQITDSVAHQLHLPKGDAAWRSPEDLIEHIHLHARRQVVVVVDALDEAAEPDALMRFLISLATTNPAANSSSSPGVQPCRVLIATRPRKSILEAAVPSGIVIDLDTNSIDNTANASPLRRDGRPEDRDSAALHNFIAELNQAWEAAGPPSYSRLEKLSEYFGASEHARGLRVRVLTASTSHDILTGKRSSLPEWPWVVSFVNVLRIAAVENALDPDEVGTVAEWKIKHRAARAIIRSRA
jgi:hypothetical protein